MEKETTDKRTEKTRANIRKAFLCLAKEKEISEISVRELTEAAHIHRNTFYIHYSDMYSILSDLEEDLCRRIQAMTEAFTPGQLAEHVDMILEKAFQCIYDERERCCLLLKYRGFVSSGKNLLEGIFEKYLMAFPNKFDRNSLEFQVQFYYCTTGALGIVRYWLEHDFKEPPQVMAEITGKLLIKGIQGAMGLE